MYSQSGFGPWKHLDNACAAREQLYEVDVRVLAVLILASISSSRLQQTEAANGRASTRANLHDLLE